MDEVRNQFIERHENEAALVQPRMRQREKLGFTTFIFANQQVEIDGARTHVNVARPSQRVLDSQQSRQYLFGRRKRRTAQLGYHVQKLRLVLVFDRLCFVDVREANHVESRIEHSAHREQQVSGAVAEVRTESDVGVLDHPSA